MSFLIVLETRQLQQQLSAEDQSLPEYPVVDRSRCGHEEQLQKVPCYSMLRQQIEIYQVGFVWGHCQESLRQDLMGAALALWVWYLLVLPAHYQ